MPNNNRVVVFYVSGCGTVAPLQCVRENKGIHGKAWLVLIVNAF
jgi:hypothetical protein